MRFRVIGHDDLRKEFRNEILLQRLSWNDWWQFKTSFYAYYANAKGERVDLGGVKIGRIDQQYVKSKETGGDRTEIDAEFESLGEEFVSLGQDESYYENVMKVLGSSSRKILSALRDIVHDPSLYEASRGNPVVWESLTRSVATSSVEGVFRKIVDGDSSASSFHFTFVKPNRLAEPLELEINVRPDSRPPSNVHVLIGRNGSGKTTLLTEITRTFLNIDDIGCEIRSDDRDGQPIANLVHIGFSAFDVVKVPVVDAPLKYPVAYSYVGLHYKVRSSGRGMGIREIAAEEDRSLRAKADIRTRPADELADTFASSAWRVISEKSRERWREALTTLESDINFEDAHVSNLADADLHDEGAFLNDARERFDGLSSGHKIVLLTVTRLVETVTEQTLVLLDEPEGHLHPPLLAAFVRALSDLMKKRNGVAIIATHSPVVLQEVPMSCVNVVSRYGSIQKAERPERETFGENVGVLTNAVFGLEVQASGFHKMLTDARLESSDSNYESVVAEFGDELGFEARALLRAWFSRKVNR
jgi:predicted ATPase